jgi:NitT/TauT family transport system substrate-binding protein
MIISRRHFITKVAIGMAAAPWMRNLSWAQTKGKLGYMKIVDVAAMFMAMEKGFFKSEGLELETVPMAGGAVIVQGVTSGDLQIGWTNVISLYQTHVEGFDFKLVAPGASNGRGKNESHAILVAKASPFKSAKDLDGKTIAVNTLNNIVHLMAMAWIDKNGGSSRKVKFVEVPFPQMEAALSGGKLDAVSVHEPFATAAMEKGGARLLSHPWGDVLAKFHIAGWFASEKWVQKNKEMTQAFIRAIGRGVDAIQADPEAGRAAMVKWAGLNPGLAGKIGLPIFDRTLSEKDLQATIDLTHKYKMISRAIKARDLISDLAPKG